MLPPPLAPQLLAELRLCVHGMQVGLQWAWELLQMELPVQLWLLQRR